MFDDVVGAAQIQLLLQQALVNLQSPDVRVVVDVTQFVLLG